MVKFLFLKSLLFLLLLFSTVKSDVLIFDLSDDYIQISKENNNPDFTIFGFTDSKSSLVLKIKGPSQKVILQKKIKL